MCLPLQNKNYLSVLVLIIAGSSISAQEIELSPNNTSIIFEITHLGVLTVEGTFNDFIGSISQSDSGYSIIGTIKAASINTQNSERDETLRTDAYFDVEVFPEIIFKGHGVKMDNKMNVLGTLFLKDFKTELDFDFIQEGEILVADQIVISRKKLGFTFGSTEFLIGDEVVISIKIEGNFL